jgi:serine/threonine-protein kinase RsbW
MTAADIRLTFPARADYLLLARLVLSGIARAYPVDPELLADLKLAVTEACGNAVRHAYDDAGGPVTVLFTVDDDRLEIVVEDEGGGVQLPAVEDWTLPEDLEGGMGMAIIRAVVDEVDVQDGPDGHGTVLRMTKYLSASA